MFKIGDRVKICGKYNGTITEILEKKVSGECLYEITLEGSMAPSKCLYKEADLELLPNKKEYRIEMEIAENVVICKMFDVTGGGSKEISRGHGHVIHEGDIGYAQAASYAAKQMYTAMNGGSYV